MPPEPIENPIEEPIEEPVHTEHEIELEKQVAELTKQIAELTKINKEMYIKFGSPEPTPEPEKTALELCTEMILEYVKNGFDEVHLKGGIE